MNIKEHIEAGHYPTDDKGRALVPMRGGKVATIYATDHDPVWFIAGKIEGIPHFAVWLATGNIATAKANEHDLLPPPPRKVKVVKTLSVPVRPDGTRDPSREEQLDDGDERDVVAINKHWRAVLLTGEYEEPWT